MPMNMPKIRLIIDKSGNVAKSCDISMVILRGDRILINQIIPNVTVRKRAWICNQHYACRWLSIVKDWGICRHSEDQVCIRPITGSALEKLRNTWWRHQMETFSALLAICAGNSPVAGEFPAQRPVTRSFGVFFDRSLNERLSKQSWGWCFETLSRPLWRHSNDIFSMNGSLFVWRCLVY